MSSNYSLVMLAYPTSYRDDHGAELVDTANELAEGWSFRQSRSLLVEGLRTRTRVATEGSPRNALASGVAFAVGMLQLIWLESALLEVFDVGAHGSFAPPVSQLVLAAVPLVAVTVSTRWPTAMVSITSVVAGLVLASRSADEMFFTSNLARPVVWLVLLMWLAVRTDGPRAFPPAVGAAWLGGAVAVGVTLSTFALPLFYLAAILVIGVLMIRVDPRPSAAATALLFHITLTQAALVFDFDPSGDLVSVAVGSALVVAFALTARHATRRTLTVDY